MPEMLLTSEGARDSSTCKVKLEAQESPFQLCMQNRCYLDAQFRRQGLAKVSWMSLVSLFCSSVSRSLPALCRAESSGVVYFAVSFYEII